MAKFDEEAWKRQLANEIAQDAAREDIAAQDDAQLRRELTDMFGTSNYDDIIKAVGASEGFSDADIKAMQKAGRLARKELQRGHADKAEKIIMSSRGMREVRKAHKKSKGCVVTLGMIGASASLTVWGLAEGYGALFG